MPFTIFFLLSTKKTQKNQNTLVATKGIERVEGNKTIENVTHIGEATFVLERDI